LSFYEGKRGELIPILQEVQTNFGHLPDEAMLRIARFIRYPLFILSSGLRPWAESGLRCAEGLPVTFAVHPRPLRLAAPYYLPLPGSILQAVAALPAGAGGDINLYLSYFCVPTVGDLQYYFVTVNPTVRKPYFGIHNWVVFVLMHLLTSSAKATLFARLSRM